MGKTIESHNNLINIHSHFEVDGVIVVVWYLDLQLPAQSVLITTKFMSSNPVHGEVSLIQHYAIKFVNDLWQVGGIL